MLQVLLLTFLAVFFVWYALWHWNRRHLYRSASKLKGPQWLPFVGNALLFSGSTEEILKTVIKMLNHYGNPVPIWLASRFFYIVSSPKDLEIILNSPKALEKDDLYVYARDIIGMGLFASPVSKWKGHRRLITPTFNQKILDSFMEIFAEQSEILVKCLREDAGGNCDVVERFGRLTLDTISETALGLKMNSQTTNNMLAKKIERALEILYLRMFQIWYHLDFMFRLTPYYKEQKLIIDEVHKLADDIIQVKKEDYRIKQENKHNEAAVDDKANKRKVFLDLLIEEEGVKFTDTDLRDETTTMIIAGSDTTATADCFFLLCLALYPEIQEKVYKEVIDVIGHDRPVEKEDLPQLKYLERVIKESMRYFPIGPLVVRKISEDLEISNNIVVPANSGVVLVFYHVHFNPVYWPDPYKFDPDRFLPEITAQRHPYAFLPFSAGPRNCIGPKYAMMSMKVSLATVVRRYKFFTEYKSLRDVRVQQDLIIKPVEGYKMRIENRE